MLVLRQPGGASGAPSLPCLAGLPRFTRLALPGPAAAALRRVIAALKRLRGKSRAAQPLLARTSPPVPTSLPGRTDGANGGAGEEQGAGSSQQKGPAMVGETV